MPWLVKQIQKLVNFDPLAQLSIPDPGKGFESCDNASVIAFTITGERPSLNPFALIVGLTTIAHRSVAGGGVRLFFFQSRATRSTRLSRLPCGICIFVLGLLTTGTPQYACCNGYCYHREATQSGGIVRNICSQSKS
jgi:hypothetical protein